MDDNFKNLEIPAGWGNFVSRGVRFLTALIAFAGASLLILSGVTIFLGLKRFQLDFETAFELTLGTLFFLFGGYLALYGRAPGAHESKNLLP